MNTRILNIAALVFLATASLSLAQDSLIYRVIEAAPAPQAQTQPTLQAVPAIVVPTPSAVEAAQSKINTIVNIVGLALAGLVTITGAVVATLSIVLPKLSELKAQFAALSGRQDRQGVNNSLLQQNQLAVALATPPVPVVAPTAPVAPKTGDPGEAAFTSPSLAAAVGILSLALLFAPLAFVSCATDTGNVSKDRAGRVTNAVLVDVFNTVLQAGLSYGASALEGQNGQDAAQAAFIAAGEKNGISALGTILTAYAGPEIAPVASVALDAVAKANPQTPAERVAVLNTVGAALQSVANQLAK